MCRYIKKVYMHNEYAVKRCLQTKPVVIYHILCRSNLENIISQGYSGGFRKPGLSPGHFAPPPPEYPPPQSSNYQHYGKPNSTSTCRKL